MGRRVANGAGLGRVGERRRQGGQRAASGDTLVGGRESAQQVRAHPGRAVQMLHCRARACDLYVNLPESAIRGAHHAHSPPPIPARA
eukprot:3091213-Prymnesium_polylepis.2